MERRRSPTPRLRILRLDNDVGWESAPYNQFSLPLAREQDITICTFFPAPIRVGPEVELVEGDGTVRGYVRVLRELLSTRTFDLVHAHTPHVGSLYAMLRRLLGASDLPSVFTVHNCYSSYKRRNKLLLLPTFARFDRVVCCSEASRDSFPPVYDAVGGRRLTVIQNGVDLARIDRTIAGDSRPDGRFTAVSVGRLIPIKNPAMAARALAAASNGTGRGDARLVYIGEGPLRARIRRAADAVSVADRVSFAGRVPRDEVFRRLRRADVLISTSRGEGLPVAILEAMACRCPVILSDIAPHREIAAGVPEIPLVPPDDEAGFARELSRFRDMPEERRKAIGEVCREVVESRFGLDRMLGRYRALYRELLSGRRSEPPRSAEADRRPSDERTREVRVARHAS